MRCMLVAPMYGEGRLNDVLGGSALAAAPSRCMRLGPRPSCLCFTFVPPCGEVTSRDEVDESASCCRAFGPCASAPCSCLPTCSPSGRVPSCGLFRSRYRVCQGSRCQKTPCRRLLINNPLGLSDLPPTYPVQLGGVRCLRTASLRPSTQLVGGVPVMTLRPRLAFAGFP